MVFLSGCSLFEKGFLDPSQVGRFKKEGLAVNILDHLDTALEQPDQRFVSATPVSQEDLKVLTEDYAIGANDQLTITVADIMGPGIETVKTSRVSESGNISLPLVGQVQAAGKTEAQLEEAIKTAYRDKGIIQNAQVSATVTEPRNRTFSIWGSVARTGEFAIVKADYRVLDALVAAGDIVVPDLDTLYVVRKTSRPGATTQPATQDSATPAPRETGPAIPEPGVAPAAAPATQAQPAQAPGSDRDQRVIITPDNKQMVVGGSGANTPATASFDAVAPGSFEFNEPRTPEDLRVIRVPLKELRNGDFRYNVVIRPGDMLVVPAPVTGFYYMAGHVVRTGTYQIANTKITLKQAVAAAGMLDAVAIPERTDVIRRVGPNKEVFVRVDLSKIWAGEQPDFYLKPDDTVNVGTNAIAPFLAALRNAFRITYGFGFVYDRNFAEPDPFNTGFNSNSSGSFR